MIFAAFREDYDRPGPRLALHIADVTPTRRRDLLAEAREHQGINAYRVALALGLGIAGAEALIEFIFWFWGTP